MAYLLICGLAPIAVIAQEPADTAGSIHAEIQSTYNFQPHLLTSAQIQEKSSMLDRFWAKAKSRKAIYIPGLRHELADFSNSPFFLFDGSQLLLTLSNEPSDRKIVLAAIARADLRDLQLRDYFLLVHRMAAEGEDTTAAAFRILAEPKFQVFIPQHSLTLGQNYSLVYMLLPTNPEFWLQPAIERLRAESDQTSQQSLLLLLWYAQTPEADNAIKAFSVDTTKPLDSTGYAKELLHRKDSIEEETRSAAAATTEESLRQSRRERLKTVSDEALIDLDTLTEQIIAKRG